MATSKRQRNAPTRPDPKPFERLIREDLAPVDAVLDAYERLLGYWYEAGGHDEVEVVSECPVVDPEAPESIDAMLIRRRRRRLFTNHDPRGTYAIGR